MPRKRPTKVTVPPKLAPPDFNNHAHSSGGDLSELYALSGSDDPVMLFPNDHGVRQRVDVEVNTWRGNSIGATHFYGTVEPEENRIWDGHQICWRSHSDHPATKRQTFKCSVHTREDAVRFVEVVLRTFFADESRYLVTELYAEEDGIEAVLRSIRRDTGIGG